MKIIKVGMPRSGNVWLHTILSLIFEKSCRNFKSYISADKIIEISKSWGLGYDNQSLIDWIEINRMDYRARVSTIYKKPIVDLRAYLDAVSVVSTHSYFNKNTTQLFNYFDLSIYLLRDPRDILISRSKYDFSDYMKRYYPHPYTCQEEYIEERLEEVIGRWVSHVSGYLLNKDELKLHLIFYEDLLNDTYSEIKRTCKVLNLDIEDTVIDQIIEDTAIEKMRVTGYSRHVWQGKAGIWKQFLNKSQQDRAKEIGGFLMESLGYGDDAFSANKNYDFLNKNHVTQEMLENAHLDSQRYVDSTKTYDHSIPSYM